MKEQGVVFRWCVVEIPFLSFQETVILRMNAEFFVIGNIHIISSTPPLFYFSVIKTRFFNQMLIVFAVLVAKFLNLCCCKPEILSSHQICISIVVNDGIVLVRTGYSMNTE